jgi:protein-S-isoprenylcysteine O-methyltransferase Ste14
MMLDRSLVLLVHVMGFGPVLLLLAGMTGAVDLHLSTREALGWDSFLSLAFFLQHSVMVRRSVKARIAQRVPARYIGALFASASGAVLVMVVLLWQRTEGWFTVADPLRWGGETLSALAVAGLVWGAASLRGFDPLGLRTIRRHRSGRPDRIPELQVRGPYRWVRHPLYLCLLLLIWANPELSADRLLFRVLWTAWIVVGTILEERDLVAEMGPPYLAYRRQVPMLIPWRGPAGVDLVNTM